MRSVDPCSNGIGIVRVSLLCCMGQRRRAGCRSVTIEIGERDVAGLIRRGHLDPESRNDCTAIRGALRQRLQDLG